MLKRVERLSKNTSTRINEQLLAVSSYEEAFLSHGYTFKNHDKQDLLFSNREHDLWHESAKKSGNASTKNQWEKLCIV